MWSSHVPFMGKAFSSFSCTALLVAWHSQWKKQRERERDETHIIRTSKWKMKTVTISFENENEKNAHTIWHNQKEEEKNGAANAMAKQKRCECFFFLVVLVLECQALLGSGGVCSVQCESARCDSIQFSTCIHNYAIIRFPRSKCLLFFFVLSCFTFQRTTQRRN